MFQVKNSASTPLLRTLLESDAPLDVVLQASPMALVIISSHT